jgi:chlorite dismutase
MTDTPAHGMVLQALALGLDPGWRRRDPADRADDGRRFLEAFEAEAADGVTTVPHGSIGLEPGVDLLLWRVAPTVDALEAGAARLLRCGLGT